MSSAYARAHLLCQSWHKLPHGATTWDGRHRAFCRLPAGHTGAHETYAESEAGPVQVTWPNTLGIPHWMRGQIRHGLAAMGARARSRSDNEAINHLQDWLDELD